MKLEATRTAYFGCPASAGCERNFSKRKGEKMISKKGKPISGGAGQFRPTPNVLANAADTSRDAQRLVRASASPFQNRQGQLNVPVPSVSHNKAYGSTGGGTKPRPWGAAQPNSTPRAGTTADMLAAVGEPRLPRGYTSIISGYATKPQRIIGGGNQPSAKGRKRF